MTEKSVYFWGDELTRVGLDEGWADGGAVELAVGADSADAVTAALARWGWTIRSRRDSAGRSGVSFRSEKR